MSLSRPEKIKTFIYYNYEEDIDNDKLCYIFYNEIGKLSEEGELLPHHKFYINFEKKYCIFKDFEIDYETGKKIYTKYKIILRQSGRSFKFSSSFNIFIFNKI